MDLEEEDEGPAQADHDTDPRVGKMYGLYWESSYWFCTSNLRANLLAIPFQATMGKCLSGRHAVAVRGPASGW
jgi:hypothetical protein